MTTPAAVIERLFTTENPDTGSRPPPAMAWVVFANGTCFFTTPTDTLAREASHEQIAEAARAAIRELGPVVAGSPSADFSSVRLSSWYPEEPVWFITFEHDAIATVVVSTDGDLAAGLEGRGRRQLDHDELAITVVRAFDGTINT